jgi:uncharacterized protein YjdB
MTLPTGIDGYKVTVISGEFSSLSYKSTWSGSTMTGVTVGKYTNIKIPSGYTTIEANAFANQTKLYRIQIPATVKTIDPNAFTGCDLSKLTIVAPYGSYAETYAETYGINYSAGTSLKIDYKGATMYAGETKQIAVMNNSKTATWKSSKTSVATVDSTGTITAKAAGTTTITTTINGKAYTKKFTVLARTSANVKKVIWANYVKAGMSDYERAIAATKWLSDNVSKSGTSASADTAFETGSANSVGYANAYKAILDHYKMTVNVTTVSGGDDMVFIGTKAYVASTLGAQTGVDKDYTHTGIGSVTLNKRKLTLTVGKTGTFKVTGAGTVTWTSSNKKVATVSSKGKVTAKGAGSCTVTLKTSKKTYKCTVRVNK